MERRGVRLVVLALVVAVAAIVWWTGHGGGGEENAEVGQTKEPEAAAPRERPPEPLAPKPIETVATDVPKPSPRKRAQPLGVGGGTLSVAGRAVDEAGRPVAKPAVEVVVPDGTFADTVGDDDGRFTVPVFLLYGRGPLHAFVEARATDGRLARKEFVVRSDDRFERSSWRQKDEVGDLVLREPLDVDVLVVAPSGGPVAAEVFATSADAKWAVARVVATTGKDGRGRLVGLTPESHRLVAVASGFGRGTTMWTPGTPGSGDGAPVRITLAAERRIDVTVVDDATKTPLARAEVEVLGLADSSLATGFAYLVPPIAPVTTDEAGHATLAGLRPDVDVAVTARDETAAKQQDRSRDNYGRTLVARGRSFVVVPRGDTSVTLALAEKRTIEWPIEAGEVPVPADGTPIRIGNPAGSGRPSSEIPIEGRVELGHLVVDGCLARSFYAEAKTPDGAIARLYAAPEQSLGAPIKFQRGRRVEVTLKNADGSPAAGLLVQFQQEGGNPVGAPIKTDADGRAILDGQMGLFRTATLVTEGSPWMGTPLGSATISDGDGRIEVTIPADREAVVRVKADAALNLEQVGVHVSGLPATILSRDVSRSELRIRWRPLVASGPGVSSEYGTHAGVMAPGFLPADAKIPDGDVPVVDVELHAAASISVTLNPPARASLIMLQRFDASARRWRTIAENNVGGRYGFQITSDGRGSIVPIEPGRYRWYDARSGTVSEECDAAPGGRAESMLDLTKVAVVRGRVEAPAGESVGGIEIVRLGPDGPLPSGQMSGFNGVRTNAEGEFEIRVPGDQPVRLTIQRGALVPAPDGGEVEVTGPRDDVVLRAVRGATAVLRFDKELRSDFGTMRVLLFRGEPTGEPEFATGARIEGSRLSFAGFPLGRYTLWIDSAPFAPTILRGVDLRDGENDLGKATVSVGTTVVLKILTKDGMSAPHLQFSGSSLGEIGGAPNYFRRTDARGNEARLSGLGAGRVHVSTFAQGVPRGVNKTLDVDGTGEVTVELDLR